MASMNVNRGYYTPGAATPTNSPLANQYNLYNSAVTTQAKDYDTLTGGYQQLFNKAMGDLNNPANRLTAPAGGYTPAQFNYAPTGEYEAARQMQENLAATGGLTGADQQNLRERGISPIRAVYANANRDIDRQRVLQGGFSPNYTASKAKLSRDLSQSIADQATNVNAQIAQMIQQGKLSATPQLLDATQHESDVRNQYGRMNTDAENAAKQFNLELPLKYAQANASNLSAPYQAAMAALNGQTNLYGTTPALSRLFGDQAQNAAQFQFGVNQANANSQNAYTQSVMNPLYRQYTGVS